MAKIVNLHLKVVRTTAKTQRLIQTSQRFPATLPRKGHCLGARRAVRVKPSIEYPGIPLQVAAFRPKTSSV